MRSIKVSVAAVIVVLIGLAGTAWAQQPFRLSDKEMKDLLKRIDKQAQSFRSSLKGALERSRFDDTKAEDRINDFVKSFEEATGRLKERFDDKDSASTEVAEVLRRAERINNFMERQRLGGRAENDWVALRGSLDDLAEAYNVSWSWTDR
jgi:hypothetical protein